MYTCSFRARTVFTKTMRANKSAGKIFGAALTSKERKALDMEVKRQLAEYDKKHKLELQALFLWILHERLGFGKQRLRQIFDIFDEAFDELIERYDLEEKDSAWLCTMKLKDYGVDIEEWNNSKDGDTNGR